MITIITERGLIVEVRDGCEAVDFQVVDYEKQAQCDFCAQWWPMEAVRIIKERVFCPDCHRWANYMNAGSIR